MCELPAKSRSLYIAYEWIPRKCRIAEWARKHKMRPNRQP